MPSNPDGFYPDKHSQRSQRSNRERRSQVEAIPVLDAAEQVTVSISMLREHYDSIMRIVRANGCEPDEGMLLVLMSGLGYMDASLQIEGINRADEVVEAARRAENLVQDLAQYHSMYAVMKYKAFKMYKINQTLEFNVAGLRATERMWEQWAERMRREQADLRAEVLRLRSVMSEFTVSTPNVDGSLPSEHRLDEVLALLIPTLQKPLILPQPGEGEKMPPPAGTVEILEQALGEGNTTDAGTNMPWWRRLFRRMG